MTTWTAAAEENFYVEPSYVDNGYVRMSYDVQDGSGTAWAIATEASTAWTEQ